MAEATLYVSPGATVRAERIMFDALTDPPFGTRWIVTVRAVAVELVKEQAEMVVIVLAGTV